MDQEHHEPNWEEVERDRPNHGRLLCAQCVAALMGRVQRARVHYHRGGTEDLMWSGVQLVDAVRRAREDGHRVETLNGFTGLYADTMVNGTAVCAAHLLDSQGRLYLFP